MLSTEASDAALARELQLEEYGGASVKRQRTKADIQKSAVPSIKDSEDELSLDWNSHVSPVQRRQRSTRSRQKPLFETDGEHVMSDNADNTDDADDNAYSPSGDDPSEADEAASEAEEQIPVVASSTSRRGRRSVPRSGSRRQRRASRTEESALPSYMGRRVWNGHPVSETVKTLTQSRHNESVENWKGNIPK